jgi:putative transcriptional regulator
MSQKKLVELIGVSRQTVNAIESSKYSPSLEVAFRIAHAFGMSIEDVFFYEPDIDGEHEFADGLVVEVCLDGKDDSGET